MRNIIIDAGPLIALFAVDVKHHRRFDGLVLSYSETGLRLITTWPCVMEASYILEAPQRFEMLRWIEMGGLQVYPFDAQHLGDMVGWMRQYAEMSKREMDLADASVYWLATVTGVKDILTVDLADFSRYRLPNGQAFTIL